MTGDTVNTTARLLAAAVPARSSCRRDVRADARTASRSSRLGELALRGKSEPVVVHRLLGARAERGSARGLAALGLAAPLIGRADELEQLLARSSGWRAGGRRS